jgi:hypothetical protein
MNSLKLIGSRIIWLHWLHYLKWHHDGFLDCQTILRMISHTLSAALQFPLLRHVAISRTVHICETAHYHLGAMNMRGHDS